MRLFIDFVGILGDTLALNDNLNVFKHSENAYCHLCRIKRNPNLLPDIQRKKVADTSSSAIIAVALHSK